MGDRRITALIAVGVLYAGELRIPLGLDRYMPVPDSNPLRAESAAVGRRLFFDKRLSRDGSVSCATCHDPKRAFTDAEPLAVGIAGRKGARRTPSIVNRGYGRSFFWDGRVASLEEQVLKPVTHPDEMDLTIPEALARLKSDPAYPPLDERAMADSLASYIRTILAGGSPYDRYVQGGRSALSADQVSGLKLFRGKAGCANCHVGPNLTDERFHNTGLPGEDPGRFAVTKREEDRGAFKTPTLRELEVRAPYMHDGSLATIEDVIEHYDKGGKENPNLDPEMRPLKLTTREKADLRAFLRALTGTVSEGLQ